MKLVLYSFAGSALVLAGLLWAYAAGGGHSFALGDLAAAATHFSRGEQLGMFALVFFGFAVLAGLFPFHTWAPTGHVAAPTAASMLLAGVVMKLGAYGCLRVAMPLFPVGLAFWQPAIGWLAVAGIVYAGCIALVQDDFKFVIGYSSVSHMGFVLLGLAAANAQAVSGAVLQMFSHGIIAGLLFAVVGRMVYDRTHTRKLADLRAMPLHRRLPFAATIFVIAGLASMGLPGFSGFPAELTILIGAWKTSPVWAAIAALGVLVAAAFTLRAIQVSFFWHHARRNSHDLGRGCSPAAAHHIRRKNGRAAARRGHGAHRFETGSVAQLDRSQPAIPALPGGPQRRRTMTLAYPELIRALAGEAALVGGALAVLTFDLTLGRRRPLDGRWRAAALIGVGTILVALALVLRVGAIGSVFGGGFMLDALGVGTCAGVLALAGLTLLLASGTARLRNPAEFVAIVLLATTGFMLMAVAQQLLLAFLAIELASLSLYVLTGFDKTRPESAEAALKYFLVGGMSAAFLLFGFSLLYGLTGSIDFSRIAAGLAQEGLTPLLSVALVMVLVAFGFKAAAAPFHLWAPDAYQGAPPTAAALIASASKLAVFHVLLSPAVAGTRHRGRRSSDDARNARLAAGRGSALRGIAAARQHWCARANQPAAAPRLLGHRPCGRDAARRDGGGDRGTRPVVLLCDDLRARDRRRVWRRRGARTGRSRSADRRSRGIAPALAATRRVPGHLHSFARGHSAARGFLRKGLGLRRGVATRRARWRGGLADDRSDLPQRRGALLLFDRAQAGARRDTGRKCRPDRRAVHGQTCPRAGRRIDRAVRRVPLAAARAVLNSLRLKPAR